MQRLIVVATVLVLGAVARPLPVSAQLPGTPVYNMPVPSGFTLSADVGFPSNSTGLGTVFEATGSFGTGPFGFSASVGTAKFESPIDATEIALGGTVNWKIFGGPLIPLAVNLQVGGAYWTVEGTSGAKIKNVHVPVGVGIVLTIPTPGLAIKPWIAPRADYNSVNTEGSSTTSSTNFAWSAGIDLGFLSGLGIHAAYDWLRVDGTTFSTIGVGASYSFKTPGF